MYRIGRVKAMLQPHRLYFQGEMGSDPISEQEEIMVFRNYL